MSSFRAAIAQTLALTLQYLEQIHLFLSQQSVLPNALETAFQNMFTALGNVILALPGPSKCLLAALATYSDTVQTLAQSFFGIAFSGLPTFALVAQAISDLRKILGVLPCCPCTKADAALFETFRASLVVLARETVAFQPPSA